MRYLKKYTEGGKLPPGKLGDLMHALKNYSNKKGEKYSTYNLLDALKFTKGGEENVSEEKIPSMFDPSIFGSEPAPERPADFSSFRDKKSDDVKISEYIVGSGYEPGVGALSLKSHQLNKLAGRNLKPTEEKEFRQVLSDPTMLKYFMDMMEKNDMDFSKKKMGGFNASKGGNKGVGTGGRGHGEGSKVTEIIKDGIAYICMDGTCKPK